MDSDSNVQMNFYADWVESLRNRLTEYGDPPEPGTSDEKVEFQYFNVVRRTIAPRPRRVHRPTSLCISQDLVADFSKFVDEVQRGTNLNPYLSRNLKTADYDDLFLNDWGIHHFHLGNAVESDGFVARRDPLLFARVTNQDIYVCGFFPHGAWEDYVVMEILHANWPESLERFKLTGMTPSGQRISSGELRQARRDGLMVPLQMLDGTLYMSPGGGITTAKLGAEVVDTADRHRDWISSLEAHVRAELPSLKPQIEEALHRTVHQFAFRLGFQDGHAFAVDQSLGITIRLGPVPS